MKGISEYAVQMTRIPSPRNSQCLYRKKQQERSQIVEDLYLMSVIITSHPNPSSTQTSLDGLRIEGLTAQKSKLTSKTTCIEDAMKDMERMQQLVAPTFCSVLYFIFQEN